MSHLADLRKDYHLAGLSEKDLARDPFRQFDLWSQEAEAARLPEPNAMVLATATRDGRPFARTVLFKGFDGRGVVFYTNHESRKGREVPLSPCRGGYRLAPESVEFWPGSRSRLHDRLRDRRGPSGGWMIERLAP
jgi:pyridoxine/pyridoxamine 5'-phosphate oxidase